MEITRARARLSPESNRSTRALSPTTRVSACECRVSSEKPEYDTLRYPTSRSVAEHHGRHMCCTCGTLTDMPKMIQIRNVPDELHRTLKVRAAKAGMTLSDYLLSEIEQIAEKPSLHEWLEKVSRDESVEVEEPPESIIRKMRDADDPRDLG